MSFAPNVKLVVVERKLHLTADASARLDDAAADQGVVGYYVEGGAFYDAPNPPDEANLTAGLKFAKKTATEMSYEQYFRREEVCTPCTTALQKPFVYLCIPASRYVEIFSGLPQMPDIRRSRPRLPHAARLTAPIFEPILRLV